MRRHRKGKLRPDLDMIPLSTRHLGQSGCAKTCIRVKRLVKTNKRPFCRGMGRWDHQRELLALRQRLRRSWMAMSPPNNTSCPDSSSSCSTIEGKISLVRGSPNPLEAPAPRKITVLLILSPPLRSPLRRRHVLQVLALIEDLSVCRRRQTQQQTGQRGLAAAAFFAIHSLSAFPTPRRPRPCLGALRHEARGYTPGEAGLPA